VSKLPGTNETLALIDQLVAAMQEFAAREQRLLAEFRTRTAADQHAFTTAREAELARRSQMLAQAELNSQHAMEGLQQRFEQRKARINRGHMESRRRALDAIHEVEGRRKYKVQEGTLNAEKRRDAELAALAADDAAFNGRLIEAQQWLAQLATSTRFAFSGYGKITRMLSREHPVPSVAAASPDEMLEKAAQAHADASRRLEDLSSAALPKWFRFFPAGVSAFLFIAGVVMLSPVAAQLPAGGPWRAIGIGLVAAGILLLLGRLTATSKINPTAKMLASDLATIQQLLSAAAAQAHARSAQEQARIHAEFEAAKQALNQEWKKAVKEGIDLLGERPRRIDEQAQRVTQKNEAVFQRRLQRIELEHPAHIERLEREGEEARLGLEADHQAREAQREADRHAKFSALAGEWKQHVWPIFETLSRNAAEAQQLFPSWQDDSWAQWDPPNHFINAARFGELHLAIPQLTDRVPQDSRLAPPAENLAVPLLLTYPDAGSLLVRTTGDAAPARTLINSIIFRLLAATPPGKLSFTIFDPVGLGQSFAGLMHLADYEESHINSRIWTQSNHLEEKLAELNEHMEKVIQMYLRNEYPTITEYNAQAGSIAEKYHFLVIADFPVNFSDTALRRLINIVSNGARCGVYTLIHWDQRQPLPQGFVADELRKNSVELVAADGGFAIAGTKRPGTRLVLDEPPPAEVATRFLHQVGESGRGSNRVEVPFSHVAPPEPEIWSRETAEELRVAIGRSGATKLQWLEIGRGTRQHALIAGKTGSGKSTLFHIIITNLALWCRPEEVEFYLVDFKKGVEFKGYATHRLPHARVVAIESDRQFGLSVLQRVDDELRRRGDLFRTLGVQDLAGYRRSGGKEPMPRSLLLIDEFQEFFTEEDRVSQGAAVLLDRIVRQGRAFGIHVILGSQTLGGAYTLARATLGQMVIRIALMCNEADAYLIMDQDNPAPRLLSRPGEGIYNDAAGAIDGNSPFQAVWLSEEERERYLIMVRERAARDAVKHPGPFVFEGNAAADIRDNILLQRALELPPAAAPASARVWLGAPNSIKGPTEAVFQRQSGSHLLIVGQSEESTSIMLGTSLIALAAQYPAGDVRFVVLESPGQGSGAAGDFLDRAAQMLSADVQRVRPGELAGAMKRLAEEFKAREESSAGPDTYVLIQGLQNFRKLRPEDEFGFSSSTDDAVQPAAVLQSLITEGSARGIHIIASCDTYNNVSRYIGRKTLSEFSMRVLFQMSASDSAALIDEPDAGTLGMHRALFYNDREGYLETFRPYALPDPAWLAGARAFRPLQR